MECFLEEFLSSRNARCFVETAVRKGHPVKGCFRTIHLTSLQRVSLGVLLGVLGGVDLGTEALSKIMIRALGIALLAPFMMACASRGNDATSAVPPTVPEWQDVAHAGWQGQRLKDGRFDLSSGLVFTHVAKDLVEGGWLRVSATATASSADFNVWIHVFDANGHPIARPLPTVCEVVGVVKHCTNSSWIGAQGRDVRLAFYPGEAAVVIKLGPIQQSKLGTEQRSVRQRFSALLSQVRQLYYRSDEVDWDLAEEKAALSLRAPMDVDPLPTAISLLVSSLPGNAHTYILRSDQPAGSDVVLPSCVHLAGSRWRLDLPGTPDDGAAEAYVRRAHACLTKPEAKSWLVNLTDNFGGDVFVQFAALVPLLGDGPHMQFTNSQGNSFVVSIDAQAVRLQDEDMVRWEAVPNVANTNTVFALGPGCGSSCEAVAIAVKGRFKTVGQSTAGLTTANETLTINAKYSLALTSGLMADLQGRHVPTVTPDRELDDESLKDVLNNGRL